MKISIEAVCGMTVSDDSRERKITRLVRGRTHVSVYKSRGEGLKVDRGKLPSCLNYVIDFRGDVRK